MKLVTIVGARPQFIKAAPVSRAIERYNLEARGTHVAIHEVLVHTGQHYDGNMSEVFFRELGLPKPDYNLGVGSGRHGWQTGEILKRVEDVLLNQSPDYVLVYGDTNSTVAGALAAVKLGIPVAHIEAGLRSFNRRMPEEINRVLTDHVSTLLFCPTRTAVANLVVEGVTKGVFLVGDVMLDVLSDNLLLAERQSKIIDQLKLTSKEYLLATVHRAENTDQPDTLNRILRAFIELAESGHTVVFPTHPRTKRLLESMEQNGHSGLMVIEPVSYLDMLMLEKHARVILTDSGGVQKEAFWLGVPCVTLRNETEWIETLKDRRNVLVGTNPGKILEAVSAVIRSMPRWRKITNRREAARRAVNILVRALAGAETHRG